MFHANSNIDKIYIKIVTLNVVNNFVGEMFLNLNRWGPQNIVVCFKYFEIW
jgi:hypothetical protein